MTLTRAAAMTFALLAVGAVAWAGSAPTPSVRTPLPFEHSVHRADLQRLGLLCVDCHAFDGPPSSVDTPPLAGTTCHACHRNDLPLASRAPSTCSLCHPVREELRPADHGRSWLVEHGPPGRSLGADCASCHENAVCVDCHERRGALSRTPHPAGFRALHGVEARLDPAGCDVCHAARTCTTCHERGATPW